MTLTEKGRLALEIYAHIIGNTSYSKINELLESRAQCLEQLEFLAEYSVIAAGEFYSEIESYATPEDNTADGLIYPEYDSDLEEIKKTLSMLNRRRDDTELN